MKKTKKPSREELIQELRKFGVLARNELREALKAFTDIELAHEDVLNYTYYQAKIEAFSLVYSMLYNTPTSSIQKIIKSNIVGQLSNIDNLKNKYIKE